MLTLAIVGEHRTQPSEGIQVVTQAMSNGLRSAGYQVELVETRHLQRAIMEWLIRPPDCVLFTHGPGRGTVAASIVIRRFIRTKIVWVATRPDLAGLPTWLTARRAAHGIVCNRVRADLERVAKDAIFVQQYIGIDPNRVVARMGGRHPWPELAASGRVVLLHVGHLRPNRGLDLLAAAKRRLTTEIEVVVQASPTFEPDANVMANLTASGVVVRQGYESDLGALYRAADLYVFPARPESEGAIELPLGVLEAVACGTPVLTTPFGVLPTALAQVPGVAFAEEDAFVSELEQLIREPGALSAPSLPSSLEVIRSIEAARTLVEALCNR